MMKKKTSQRGSALMLVTIIALILTGISGAYLTISWWNQRRATQEEAGAQALYIAESAAASYLAALNASGGANPKPQARTALMGGFYWVPQENLVNFGDEKLVGKNNLDPDYWSFQVAAKYNGIVRRLDVLVSHKAGGVFWNAVFAGNDGNAIDPLTGKPWQDPKYALEFGGKDPDNADVVKGNVYTSQDIKAVNEAKLLQENGDPNGKVTYGGNKDLSTVKADYVEGTEPGLEIKRGLGPQQNMNEAEYNAKIGSTGATADKYGNKIDTNKVKWVDVESQFKNYGTPDNVWKNDGSGSTARDILEPTNPAHFLRQNPSINNGSTTNRTESYEMSINQSVKSPSMPRPRNDYYIEDPIKGKDPQGNVIQNNLTDASQTGQSVNGDKSASMLNIYPESNNAVYYVDGNLRVSGENVKSYQFYPQTDTGDIKMTFVVKGNVSLTDNLLYPKWESAKDVVAIIAIRDENYPNTTAQDFSAGKGSTPLTPNGVSIDQFIQEYNQRANKSGNKMVPLDLSNPGDLARASQEYNKIYGSGNVFFGDPGSGTVEHFEAFMYAENNFYATNLDSTKSSGGTDKVEIYGNMTAGNQVSMERTTNPKKKDYKGYIPLRVTFDPAVRNGNPPPWIPDTPGQKGVDWHIASWKQSALTAELDPFNEK